MADAPAAGPPQDLPLYEPPAARPQEPGPMPGHGPYQPHEPGYGLCAPQGGPCEDPTSEQPPPSPRELALINAKAYLLQSSTKSGLSLCVRAGREGDPGGREEETAKLLGSWGLWGSPGADLPLGLLRGQTGRGPDSARQRTGRGCLNQKWDINIFPETFQAFPHS